MALAPDKIPFTRSLRDRIEDLFAPSSDDAGSKPLSTNDIVSYLAKSKDTDSSPLATIRRRAAKENRRPDLKPADHAVLAWVSEAFTEWEESYALEGPLQDRLKRLQPLAVAVALSDEAFLTPGAHPLHQLLDAIQNGAVGWQTRLDRAGQMLEQRVDRAIEKALDWFDNDRLDISSITRELVSANDRDVARAQRMVQRLEETEAARIKTLTAKREAAEIINDGLTEYKLPSAIGEFIKGAWYDSAQLVLVKFGEDSKEWEQMSRATLHLMQSVQSNPENSDADRDRQAQLLRHLPGQLRRWLISLEHDSDATDGAIGLVEYAHLRIQHGQVLDLINIPTIPVEGADQEAPDTELDEFRNGDWYRFEDEDGELRAQLVLQLEHGHHLLFANFVGLKAIDLSRLAFSQRVADGFVALLPDRETFSLSLAAAAGIDSNDKYQKFLDPNYRSATEIDAQQKADAANAEPDTDDNLSSPEISPVEEIQESDSDLDEELEFELDPEILSDIQIDQEQDGSSLDSSFLDATPDIPVDTDQPDSTEFSQIKLDPIDGNIDTGAENQFDTGAPQTGSAPPDLASQPIGAQQGSTYIPPSPDYDPVLAPPEGAELAPGVSPAPPAKSPPQSVGNPPTFESTAATATAPDSFAEQTAPANPAPLTPSPTTNPPVSSPPPERPAPQYAPPPAQEPTPTAAPPPTPSFAAPAAPTPPPAAPSTPPAPEVPAETEPAAPTGSPLGIVSADTREIEVPMGAWLGFHDGETPIMAKLAVFDPRRDNYIFVNRKGIAMRELNRAELLQLMDKGLVDILETRCYFRDEVERAREEDQ